MRIASFNVENLFARAKALKPSNWAEGEPALQAFERFNALANKAQYTEADKVKMVDALVTLRVLNNALRLERHAADLPLDQMVVDYPLEAINEAFADQDAGRFTRASLVTQ